MDQGGRARLPELLCQEANLQAFPRSLFLYVMFCAFHKVINNLFCFAIVFFLLTMMLPAPNHAEAAFPMPRKSVLLPLISPAFLFVIVLPSIFPKVNIYICDNLIIFRNIFSSSRGRNILANILKCCPHDPNQIPCHIHCISKICSLCSTFKVRDKNRISRLFVRKNDSICFFHV